MRDPRVLVGIILVIASLLGTWAVITRVANTVTVWAASKPLVSGSTIDQDSLTAVEVRLPDTEDKYVRADQSSPVGMSVTGSVAAGELVPASVLVDPARLDGRVIALDIPGNLPQAVQAGAFVDVWATDTKDEEAQPVEVLSRAHVHAVGRDEGGFTSTAGTRLEIYVPNDKLQQVLEVVATDHRVSIVAYPKETS
ncbi:SAF domain-containing protein [Brevibacterium mcbrellneri]|nr:SAF domain-containing protein [Brevibacterium mcbrellneri]